jgi:hypothetical protein
MQRLRYMQNAVVASIGVQVEPVGQLFASVLQSW